MSRLRCEGCCSESVVVSFQPEDGYLWGSCLDCAVECEDSTGVFRRLLAQANCGAAFDCGRLQAERERSVVLEGLSKCPGCGRGLAMLGLCLGCGFSEDPE